MALVPSIYLLFPPEHPIDHLRSKSNRERVFPKAYVLIHDIYMADLWLIYDWYMADIWLIYDWYMTRSSNTRSYTLWSKALSCILVVKEGWILQFYPIDLSSIHSSSYLSSFEYSNTRLAYCLRRSFRSGIMTLGKGQNLFITWTFQHSNLPIFPTFPKSVWKQEKQQNL